MCCWGLEEEGEGGGLEKVHSLWSVTLHAVLLLLLTEFGWLLGLSPLLYCTAPLLNTLFLFPNFLLIIILACSLRVSFLILPSILYITVYHQELQNEYSDNGGWQSCALVYLNGIVSCLFTYIQ